MQHDDKDEGLSHNTPDADLTPEQLDDKYNPEGDGEHPGHTRAQWRQEVTQHSR